MNIKNMIPQFIKTPEFIKMSTDQSFANGIQGYMFRLFGYNKSKRIRKFFK